jgi:hypothetical protein
MSLMALNMTSYHRGARRSPYACTAFEPLPLINGLQSPKHHRVQCGAVLFESFLVLVHSPRPLDVDAQRKRGYSGWTADSLDDAHYDKQQNKDEEDIACWAAIHSWTSGSLDDSTQLYTPILNLMSSPYYSRRPTGSYHSLLLALVSMVVALAPILGVRASPLRYGSRYDVLERYVFSFYFSYSSFLFLYWLLSFPPRLLLAFRLSSVTHGLCTGEAVEPMWT